MFMSPFERDRTDRTLAVFCFNFWQCMRHCQVSHDSHDPATPGCRPVSTLKEEVRRSDGTSSRGIESLTLPRIEAVREGVKKMNAVIMAGAGPPP